jgi:hypothetical protein
MPGRKELGLAALGGPQFASGRMPPLRDTAQAMSQENVELARRGYDAFNQGEVEMYLDPARALEAVGLPG